MEHLSGNLTDFALADILQILALTQKNCVLSLESTDFAGKIFTEHGRITYAAMSPGETMASRMAQEKLARILATERTSGFLTAGAEPVADVEWVAARHIRAVIARLVGQEKGRFWIDVNQSEIELPNGEIRLSTGLDITEVLIDTARELDEERRDASGSRDREMSREKSREQEADDVLLQHTSGRQPEKSVASEQKLSELLYAYLAELRRISFEAEVSLLIMRFASEIAGRGILFGVRGTELYGLGQFGFHHNENTKNYDAEVRDIRFSWQPFAALSRVILTSKPYVGRMLEEGWHTNIINRLGVEPRDYSGFIIPVNCGSRPVYVIYGQNDPGVVGQGGQNEIMILADQASLILDKLRLEQLLSHQQS
ncbi:MAG: DUF4388 domain-containing protein [Blastocatellia bacterium]